MKKALSTITIGIFLLSIFSAIGQSQTQMTQETLTEPETETFEFTHTVLAEYGTATWCGYCHYAHSALKNIYNSGDYPFQYVSFVRDKNPTVVDPRLFVELNLYGYPTVYFDGGAQVKVGGSTGSETQYRSVIPITGARDVYDVDIDLDVTWNGGTSMDIDITVQNNEPDTYDGTVRVYITENTSSMNWKDTSGQLYTHALLDYAFKDDGTGTVVSISSGSSWSDSTTWDGASHGFPSVTEENTLVIAAVFNDEPHQAYAYPPSTNPFTAYYVDACVSWPAAGGSSDPPETPVTPDGPTEGESGIEYMFTSSTTDPNGDQISYQFDWGNGELSGWFGPIPSGNEINAGYAWNTPGTYQVRVRAKDDNGSSESSWSSPHSITILEGAVLEIQKIQGGLLKVSSGIKNSGQSTAESITWNVALSGGLLILDGANSGTIPSLAGDTEEAVSSGLIFGLGKVKVLITAEIDGGSSESKQQSATVLLFLISMAPGGE